MAVITLKIVQSNTVIEGKVIDALRLHLTSVFKRAAPAIKRRIGGVCEELISRTQEYESLLGGTLLGELGIPDVANRLDHILDVIKTSCDVQATPITKTGLLLTGGITIGMVRSDYLDILGLSDATYTTEKGASIPWLDWILRQGDRIIVVGYDVKIPLKTPSERNSSRTGLALMQRGQGWRVPPSFSGTVDDNFITRAFVPNEVEDLLIKIMEQEIVTRL